MINRQKFNETFRCFDKDVIVEIIDIYTAEYPDRCLLLDRHCMSRNYRELSRAAHSFKGVLASFLAVEAQQYARELEELSDKLANGRIQDALPLEALHGDVEKLVSQLKITSGQVKEELQEIRNSYL